ncbi:hypothetical protein BB560_001111 [Smittium megazygosporum]|uniref:Carbohydrate-binding module family 19 domain-containing protein n=1 Tax=Smittium megazygosporum TaxID=133381 RepID=A0A2T9ZIG5_9FUNG|nr:hypothetical protein BB560_001111 [Smittium megazygosporum]
MKTLFAILALTASAFGQSCETLGNYRCLDNGKSPEFVVCGIGNIEVPMVCGVGTVCRQLGIGVYCDYPGDRVPFPPAESSEVSGSAGASAEVSAISPTDVADAGVVRQFNDCPVADEGKYSCPSGEQESTSILWCNGGRLIPIECAIGQTCKLDANNSAFCGAVERVTVSSTVAVTTTNLVTSTVLTTSIAPPAK